MTGNAPAGPTAYLFPTFTMRERADVEGFPGLADTLSGLVEEARGAVEVAPDAFRIRAPTERLDGPDTLQAQYATFLEGLACARWAQGHLRPADVVCFYSMGLFPALVHAGALSLGDGLRAMREVCLRSDRLGAGADHALGVVIGVTRPEIEAAGPDRAGIQITVEYGRRVTIVCGREQAVKSFLDVLQAAGVPDTRLFPVSAPFHSGDLAHGRSELVGVMAEISVAAPGIPILSSSDVQELRTAAAVRAELATNISSPIRWVDSMTALTERGVDLFVECGFSRELGDLLGRDFPGGYEVHQFVAPKDGARSARVR